MTNVLVAEDETPLRLLLGHLLEGVGYRVVSARDGAEALELMREDHPDVVLLDLQMPVMDGWTVLRIAGQTPELAEVPVVVMSALEDAAATLAGLHVRCCLTKPFDVDELINALRDAAEPAGRAAEARAYCGANRPTR